MRQTPNMRAEKFRVKRGPMSSNIALGNNGAFFIDRPAHPTMLAIVSDGTCPEVPEALGWEHVSLSLKNRCPTWEEMCWVKRLFWEDDEVVFQLHPAKKDWINNHPFVLHLWRLRGTEVPLPPGFLVGFREANL